MVVEASRESHEIQNLVIIGSGPAGYTAAIYAARANLSPLLITGFQKGGIQGGQLMTTTYVENFPGFPNGVMGPELMDLLKAQALRWGTKLLEVDAEKINLQTRPFVIEANKGLIKTNAVILATGANAKRLHLPNEKLFWSKGISACAICDGATPQFHNEELAVAGGGDSACEEAIYLTKYGSFVHLIVRSKQFRASAAMIDRVIRNPQIKVHWESEIMDVEGDEWLRAVKLKNKVKNDITTLSVKGLFYAIGHKPNSELVKGQIELNNNNYILTKPGRPETSLEGVFAAGDVADSEWRQGITAAGSGCKAALAAERWLNQNSLIKFFPKENIEPEKADLNIIIEESTEKNYSSNALWQKGSYALRKLYHESKNPLFVIYSSQNCGPCHVLKPQLKRVIEELNGKAQGVEIDIEIDKEIAQQAGVNGTPTVQLFNQKKLFQQWKGVKQRSEFSTAIKTLLDKEIS